LSPCSELGSARHVAGLWLKASVNQRAEHLQGAKDEGHVKYASQDVVPVSAEHLG